MYRISEAAAISKVSVRTLRYYDRIGLLRPRRTENGYRYYSDEDLDTIQSIRYYRYLGLPLRQIRSLLDGTETDRLGMLEMQLELLERQAEQTRTLIDTLKATIQATRTGAEMTNEEKFTGFSWEEGARYEDEARGLYGDEAIDESLSRQKGRESDMVSAFGDVFAEFSRRQRLGMPADADGNMELASRLLEAIREYGFDCTVEVFGYIGAGYVHDERFRENIDRFGEGTARYASEVIARYVELNG